jgi:glycosyltransferase involved in cell wall biosynthesis
VQDGGSQDETGQVLEQFRHALKHCESVPDRGQSNALNLGFRHATGDVLAYLNSDDLLLPGCLASVAQYFARHPEVDVVYGHRVVIDENGDEVGRWVMPAHGDDAMIWADYIPQETLFWRRRIWEKVGAAIDESFQFAMDWDLIMRFREAGAPFARLPRFLGAFRMHATQKTTSRMEDLGRPEIERILTRFHGREVSQREVIDRIQPFLRRHVWYCKFRKVLPFLA